MPYVPSTRKIISSYDVVFDEKKSSALAYTSQPYAEVMAMHPDVSMRTIDTTEEVMDKLDVFQFIFGKIDEFRWWDLEIISADAGLQFVWTDFKEELKTCGVTGKSGNERTSQRYTENVAYNCTLSYGTC